MLGTLYEGMLKSTQCWENGWARMYELHGEASCCWTLL